MSGGALDTSVTLDDVFAVVGARRVPLAPELAGYLVLEVAENADPAGGDVDPKSVFVGEEGTVALVKPKREGATGDAEASIRAALARLLEASGSQTPALAAASKRKSGGGLPALAEELEAALIPVNRAAGRRALARLAREVRRVTMNVGRNALPSSSDAPASTRRGSSPTHQAVAAEPTPPPPRAGSAATFGKEEEPTTARGQIPDEVLKKATPPPLDTSELPTIEFVPPGRGPSPSQADVDALIADFGVSGGGEQQHARELKALAGLEPTPPPPNLAKEPAADLPPSSKDEGVEALLAMGQESERAAPAAISRPPPPAEPNRPRRAMPSFSDERQLPTGPSKLRQARASLPSAPAYKPKGRAPWPWLVALAAIAAGTYAVTQLRPGLFASGPSPSASASAAPAPSQVPLPCIETLVVTDVPAHAEVLVRKGQAPVDVEKLPVGARLEFVATAEGFAPKRVVIPAGAAWEQGSDGHPRFEAAVQLEKSKAPHGTNDAWPAGEPGSEVGGKGPPGTVRVVATPRGAEIWMLAGLGPEAHIEQQLACNEDVDLLLAGPTTYRKRLHVAASDFVADDPPGTPLSAKGVKRVARVSAK